MKKFSLDSVLRYKQKIKEKLEVELAAVERILEGEQARLARYLDLERTCRGDLEMVQSVGAEIGRLGLYYSYIGRLKKMQRDQMEFIGRCAQSRDEKRIEVTKAHMDQKMLEKLKEKEQARGLAEENKKEQQLMDEKALRAHGLSGPR